MALTENIMMGLGRNSILESFSAIDMEQELANVEPLEEGTDPLEYMLQVAYECEMELYNINLGIVCEEYQYLRENGTEMIYEEGKIKGIVDKFIVWLKKVWEKIKSFFKTVGEKLKKVSQKIKDKVKKNTKLYSLIPTTTFSSPDGFYDQYQLIKVAADLNKTIEIVTDRLKGLDPATIEDTQSTIKQIAQGTPIPLSVDGNKVSIEPIKYSKKPTVKMSGKDVIQLVDKSTEGVINLQTNYESNKKFIDEMVKKAYTLQKPLELPDKSGENNDNTQPSQVNKYTNIVVTYESLVTAINYEYGLITKCLSNGHLRYTNRLDQILKNIDASDLSQEEKDKLKKAIEDMEWDVDLLFDKRVISKPEI